MNKILKSLIFAGAIVGTFYGCEKRAKKAYEIYESLPIADSTIELESNPLPYFYNNGFYDTGLNLTLEERANRRRLVIFYDHGFDGKLDYIKIQQKNHRDYLTTNLQELVKWQPIFEEKRNLRFGKFERIIN